MSESPVGFRHFVCIFAALDGGADVVRGVHQLGGEAVGHALAGALAGGTEYPADSERLAAVALDLHRHLVGRATDAARLDLDHGRGIAHGLLEYFETGPLGAALKLFDG